MQWPRAPDSTCILEAPGPARYAACLTRMCPVTQLLYVLSRQCQLIGRSVGLRESVSEVDFYRKKSSAENVTFEEHEGLTVPAIDVYALAPINGTHATISDSCAVDSGCAGFVTCRDDTPACQARPLRILMGTRSRM